MTSLHLISHISLQHSLHNVNENLIGKQGPQGGQTAGRRVRVRRGGQTSPVKGRGTGEAGGGVCPVPGGNILPAGQFVRLRCDCPVTPLKYARASGGPLSCSGKKGGKEPVGEGEDSESLPPPRPHPSFKRPKGARPFWKTPQNRKPAALHKTLCSGPAGAAKPPLSRGGGPAKPVEGYCLLPCGKHSSGRRIRRGAMPVPAPGIREMTEMKVGEKWQEKRKNGFRRRRGM